MTDVERLMLLKQDLQQVTTANDVYLAHLLQLAEKNIIKEGITLIDGDIECDMLVIQYAAYLFRKRAANAEATEMPRYLRWSMNNLLFSQKGQ